MPDDQQQQEIPIINAPHGDDDMMDDPQLCIVPASPVSGGIILSFNSQQLQHQLMC